MAARRVVHGRQWRIRRALGFALRRPSHVRGAGAPTDRLFRLLDSLSSATLAMCERVSRRARTSFPLRSPYVRHGRRRALEAMFTRDAFVRNADRGALRIDRINLEQMAAENAATTRKTT